MRATHFESGSPIGMLAQIFRTTGSEKNGMVAPPQPNMQIEQYLKKVCIISTSRDIIISGGAFMLKNSKIVAKPQMVDIYEQIPRGKEYEPAITIRDLPSLGRSSRISGIRTGRQHDFLSDKERNYFHILNFSDVVIDIREQFPMQLDLTLLIAEELGIKHPIDPKTKKLVHMTSDFNITINEHGKAV